LITTKEPRFKGLLLGFLVGLPIIITGALATNALISDHKNTKSQRQQVEADFLRQIKTKVDSAILSVIEGTVSKVQAAIKEDPVVATRRLIFNSDIAFVSAYRNEQRVFPPENTGATFVMEASMLAKLDGELQNARKQMQQGRIYQSLVQVTEQHLDSLLHCQPISNSYKACFLIDHQQLAARVSLTLSKLLLQYPNWEVRLSSVSSHLIYGAARETNHLNTPHIKLGSPMHEWSLHGFSKSNDVDSTKLSTLLLMVILPLLLSWAIIFISIYRNQQTQIEENEKKAELAAQLSHDLRTPIANLSLYADLIQRKASDAASVTKYGQVMQDEIERLGRVSERTISVAQGVSSTKSNALEYPDKIIIKLLDRFSAFLQKADCEVNFTGNATEPVIFDVTALESIVLQLLDNALKYGGNGQIDLTTKVSKKHLEVSVRDYGAGVNEDEKELIFSANYRGYHQHADGFGLGLASARHLARLSGGEIFVEDAKPGARFIASLIIKRL